MLHLKRLAVKLESMPLGRHRFPAGRGEVKGNWGPKMPGAKMHSKPLQFSILREEIEINVGCSNKGDCMAPNVGIMPLIWYGLAWSV